MEAWRQAAAELGISASVGKGLAQPALTGTVGGIPVRIDTYTQRSGNSNTTYTRYRVGNEVAKELFGGNDLSFEARSRFNSRYADTSVRWQGRVKSVSETGSGIEAVVNVASVNKDLYGNTDIDVIVENPSGPPPVVGATVTVVGKLSPTTS